MRSILILLFYLLVVSRETKLYYNTEHDLRATIVNHLNPNYNYIEVNKVDTVAMNIPYPGDFYTGYITVNQTSQSKIHYQLYAAGGNLNANGTVNVSAPLILSLAGGPGCADGDSYYETGPFRVISVNGTFVPVLNEVTLNDKYHLLYVDNPVGMGYSVENNDMPNDSIKNGVYLKNFLIRFFELFPSLKKQPFYWLGESYGGHWALGLAMNILKDADQTGINISGIAFANGWFDPYNQIVGYNITGLAAGVIDLKTSQSIADKQTQFQKNMTLGNWTAAYLVTEDITKSFPKGINIENYRNNTGNDPATALWLNTPSVKKGLAADPDAYWGGCQSLDYVFYLDKVQSYAPNVTYMLNNLNIKFLFYQGQDDLLVTAAGTQRAILNLGWSKLPLWAATPKKIWRDTDGNVIGTYKTYDKLTFAIVNKAGHVDGIYQPWSVKDLMTRWISNNW